MMLGQVLRVAGQRLAPIVAPAGGRAFLKEAALGAGANLALEQGLPVILGKDAPPLEQSLLRSATIGALSGPIERTTLAGLKRAVPGVSGLQPALADRLGQMGLSGQMPTRLAGMAAGAGKLGLGVVSTHALTEPLTKAITTSIFPESYSSGQSVQYGDVPSMPSASTPAGPTAADLNALQHQRQMELIYARNYKFPSYMYHISQGGAPSSFEMAKDMLSTPSVRYM
jgi:hypothetical protein